VKRRLALLVFLVAVLVSGLTAGANAVVGNTTKAGGYWACAGTHLVDFGICLKDPLPDQSPIPETPPLPA
jgi:hypothetical protein